MTKVLTIGEILVEIVATTRGDGFLTEQPLIGPFPSGAPAIFIDQVGRLGTPAAIVSRVGDDDFGQLNLTRLAADGVDTSGVAIAAGESTGSAFVRYREDGSRSFVFNIAHSAYGGLSATPRTRLLFETCTHLHVMGTALTVPGVAALILKALTKIRARGGTVSFDPNLRPELLGAAGLTDTLRQVLRQTDVFLPSGEELFLFTDSRDEATAIAELHALGISTIVLKRGARGASLFDAAGRLDIAPLAVVETDPTGAGDCFGGAFVALWARGEDRATALRYANAAGACAVTRLGPMEGCATRAELDALIDSCMGDIR
ncbi:MAG TPA: sugar kinase [Paenirhodobacter sp.]